MRPGQTDILTIGKTGLIEHIRQTIGPAGRDLTEPRGIIHGIGDDAAVFRPSHDKVLLWTSKALVEGLHFDLSFTSFRHLGWKAMVSALSNIAAMGGTPLYALITMMLPRKISVEMVGELYEGIAYACKEYACAVMGGDSSPTAGNTSLAISLLGEANQSEVTYRKGAIPGDLLCVTGDLGAAHAGLKILQREKRFFEQAESSDTFKPDLDRFAEAVEKHLMPKARFDISGLPGVRAAAHAMIDISNGLASEVHEICRQSNVGAAVYEHNLPLTTTTQFIASEFSENPIDYILYGGEDYELLFALSDQEFEKLESLTSEITIIGRITKAEEGIQFIRENGETEPLPAGR